MQSEREKKYIHEKPSRPSLSIDKLKVSPFPRPFCSSAPAIRAQQQHKTQTDSNPFNYRPLNTQFFFSTGKKWKQKKERILLWRREQLNNFRQLSERDCGRGKELPKITNLKCVTKQEEWCCSERTNETWRGEKNDRRLVRHSHVIPA